MNGEAGIKENIGWVALLVIALPIAAVLWLIDGGKIILSKGGKV